MQTWCHVFKFQKYIFIYFVFCIEIREKGEPEASKKAVLMSDSPREIRKNHMWNFVSTEHLHQIVNVIYHCFGSLMLVHLINITQRVTLNYSLHYYSLLLELQ